MSDEKLPGKEKAQDRTGGRGEVPPDTEALSLPKALVQRENEKDNAYVAFLLFAMQTPEDRSNRLIARSMNVPESNIRHWRSKFQWTERVAASPNIEWIALDVYRRLMDEHVGDVRADRLRVALDSVLDGAGFASLRRAVAKQRTANPSRLDDVVDSGDGPAKNNYASGLAKNEVEQFDPGRHMRELSRKIQEDHLRPEDLRRQIVLIDAVLGLVAQRVKSGELQVKVSDIPSLLKARALLTGLPTETVQQQPSVQQHQHAHVHVVESVRMRDAKSSNDERVVLDAMKEEVEDLQVILNAIPKRVGGE